MKDLDSKSRSLSSNMKPRTISRDLTLALTLVVIFVTILVTFVNYWFAMRNEKLQIEQKADEYLEHLIDSLELSLWAINDENISKIAESYYNNDLVAKLTITDDFRKRVLFDKQKEDSKHLINRFSKIFHRDKVIGSVSFALTPRFYRERVQQILRSSLLTVLVVIVTMILATRFLFLLFLRKPIDLLIDSIDSITEGKYGLDHARHNYKEIDIVLTKFRQMGMEIASREQSLTEINKRLEKEIQERKTIEDSLKTREEQLQSIINNTPSLVYLKDLEGRYLLVNRQFEKLFGLEKKQIIGKSDSEFTNKRAAVDLQKNDKQVLAVEQALEFEERFLVGDAHRTYLSTKFPLYDPSGKAYGVCGISTDISEIIENQQKITDALAFNEKILSESPVGISIFDDSGQCITANDSVAGIIGATKEQFLQQNLYEEEAWKTSGLIAVVERALKKDEKRRHEIKEVSPFGTPVAIDSYIVPFVTGGHKHILIMMTDIRKRIRAERETNRLRRFLKNIVDSMPSIIVGVDAEGKVTQWNLEAARETKIKPAKALGMKLDELFPAIYFDLARVRESIQKRIPLLAERVRQENENNLRFFDVSIYPLISSKVDGAVIRVDEVTERVRLEEMMIQSEKMMSIGGLAAGMAHEINNPLAAILQNVQVMRNRMKNDLAKNRKTAEQYGVSMELVETYLENRGIFSMIESVLMAGQRASKIVDNMLSFSRKGDSAFIKYDLTELLDKTVALAENDYDLKKKFDFRRIEITRDYDENLPMVACEGSQIQQVFLNILKNGAQAMGDFRREDGKPARFKLSIRSEQEMAAVVIEDNGPGMDEGIRKRVFEPFFTTKDVGSGTGLGLSLSYFIITKNHNGQMSVESSPGKGTRFNILLPIHHQSKSDFGA